MKCPRCKVETSEIAEHGIKVDFCETCKGMFLDSGKLNRIAEETAGDIEFCTIDHETFEHKDKYPLVDCPKCDSVQMKKVDFNVDSGIILDYCEHCRGLWLDKGEYEKINDEIRRLNEVAKTAPKPHITQIAEFLQTLPK